MRDVLHLCFSGVYFQGTTIGMAPIMSMCTAEQSGGIVMVSNSVCCKLLNQLIFLKCLVFLVLIFWLAHHSFIHWKLAVDIVDITRAVTLAFNII